MRVDPRLLSKDELALSGQISHAMLTAMEEVGVHRKITTTIALFALANVCSSIAVDEPAKVQMFRDLFEDMLDIQKARLAMGGRQ